MTINGIQNTMSEDEGKNTLVELWGIEPQSKNHTDQERLHT